MKHDSLKIGITCYPTFGGSGVVATEIGMAMARRGHRVHFICADVPRRLNRFQDNIFFHEVEVRDYPVFITSQYALSLVSKMVEVSTYENLDLLHVHYAIPHATSAYLARQILGKNTPKIITTLHGTDITLVGTQRSFLPITRFSISQSDGITAPSQYLKQTTYDKLNVSTEHAVEVIPNFVDTELFRPKAQDCTTIPQCVGNKEHVLVHTSNFREVKRVDDVVKVFDIVRKQFPSRLIFIGDGPERSRVEALVHDLGLKEAVQFLGKLETFVEVLQNSSVFLLPSESEGFGLAALEAMSCGVPVVASRIGGIPEVVIEDEVGFLAPVGAVEEMASKVLMLLKDAQLWHRFSANARKLAVEKFPIDRIIDQYEEYYRKILQ